MDCWELQHYDQNLGEMVQDPSFDSNLELPDADDLQDSVVHINRLHARVVAVEYDQTFEVASLRVLPVGRYYWQVDSVQEMEVNPGNLCKEIALMVEIQATHESY